MDEVQYVCSSLTDDYRYRNETDKIITTLFTAFVTGGTPKASDDIDELHRLDFYALEEKDILTSHRPLFNKLRNCDPNV